MNRMSKIIMATNVDNEILYEEVESGVRVIDGNVWITSDLSDWKVKEAVERAKKEWEDDMAARNLVEGKSDYSINKKTQWEKSYTSLSEAVSEEIKHRDKLKRRLAQVGKVGDSLFPPKSLLKD